ncbi:glycosyltransferase family 2 protein [Rouxiella badensis]|jgi:rhamnosyltransferase|uniref:Glycosyltransferase n=1 Tax=Rouxiella badensis TaxID=1646377 RepID=A0A1X0WBF9_9GAMM|nr:glycosyltransferase family 2 protein [Rouxiella badensis]MCC3704800.1 glycosyltransferase family 2 protein [Rouxiella badensis]MCC3720996.1 glycosyltransferase family 2 protein [Rouxiella badensis]MCC3729555.1 glycosyltransferase family 2 protein [Rouxiella badensis]MCC3735418.1 glycosyltransferase family 2 protein [Rouxiella badensis]MCC3741223.1 glycosyltransferase family 2 protein [Rouxiella badensis]
MSDEQNIVNSTPLAGVVVWYNPTEKEVDNIRSYVGFLKNLYVIDNSANDNSALLSSLNQNDGHIQYIPNLDNLGIATALNKGCKRAIEQGYDWILTMDQDSSFDPVEMSKFIASFESKKIEDPSIALFTPWTNEFHPIGYATRVITSGNLLNLTAYQQIGGFDDKLFIDEVDHDLCYKLTQFNYKIYTFDNARMQHKIGDAKSHAFLFPRRLLVMHHGAVRKYYIIRNRFLLRERFPDFTRDYAKFNIMLLLGVIFFEKQKWLKLRYMFKGYCDYKRNRLGRMR